ncbi:hypothetical protein D3C76_406710 [compost metagenome]
MLQARYREVTLLAVDHLMRDHPSRRLLEHLLAAVGQLEAGGNACRQFHQAVIEERRTRLQAPGHGHVVHTLDRVVDQHHGAVQAQRLVHGSRCAGTREVFAHEVAGSVGFQQPGGLHGVAVFGVAAVEERLTVGRIGIVGAVHLRVPVVTGEQLIGTLAALYALAVLGHFPRQQVEGDAVVADHRFAHGAEGGRQLVDDFVFGNAQLVVTGAVVFGDQVRILELVAALAAGIFKADGEGRQVVNAHFAQQADQQAGVDAAGQQHTHIDGCPLADCHGVAGGVEYAGGPAFQIKFTLVRVGAVLQLPPGLAFHFAMAVDAHPGAGLQLLHIGQQGAWCRYHGVEVQVVVEGHGVEHRVDVAALEQCRQGRGKAQALAVARQVQGFDAQAVAGQEQALVVALPDGQGEHAVELGQQGRAPGVVALEQHLGVAVGPEAVAQGLQLLAQFGEVVDGAVEGQRQAQGVVDHRLRRAVRQVHDLQAPMAQGDRALAMEAPGIRASRGQVMGNALYRSQVGWARGLVDGGET